MVVGGDGCPDLVQRHPQHNCEEARGNRAIGSRASQQVVVMLLVSYPGARVLSFNGGQSRVEQVR